jgi:hypothetical protein
MTKVLPSILVSLHIMGCTMQIGCGRYDDCLWKTMYGISTQPTSLAFILYRAITPGGIGLVDNCTVKGTPWNTYAPESPTCSTTAVLPNLACKTGRRLAEFGIYMQTRCILYAAIICQGYYSPELRTPVLGTYYQVMPLPVSAAHLPEETSTF